ncbi:hypothetical protein N7532_007112 [Penicillium argentinense]|uniref:Uncharacterized protein n=1 Tax=Penicillium argentinense TaxID=1131581 RepID=A0A9W9KBX4_9EURO|nr:uncharacterized protein N7532_007112 [Penicillium argentinense]KAJ5100111.1 hypothetical protein N7532_007112 [Penicillium argentinense]
MFAVWDDLVAELTTEAFAAPALDVDCVAPVNRVDLFITGDQGRDAPEVTYDNADDTMGLETASLSVHYGEKAARSSAITEAAHVLRLGGALIILDMDEIITQYQTVLESFG